MAEYGIAIYNPDGSIYFKTGNNTLVEIISDKVISINTADNTRIERVKVPYSVNLRSEVWYDYRLSDVIRGLRNVEFLAYENIPVVPYDLDDEGGFTEFFYKWSGDVLSLGFEQNISSDRIKRFYAGEAVSYRLYGVM